jgi:hypothetical protein
MQLCPLKVAARLGRVLPGLKNLADDTTVERMAETPMTVGGALMLMAANGTEEAAGLQQRLCNTLLYPKLTCGFTSGDQLGPLYYHLEEKDTMTQWLTTKALPLAIAPVGATLAALPDLLCQVPTDHVVGMHPTIKAQLVSVGGARQAWLAVGGCLCVTTASA